MFPGRCAGEELMLPDSGTFSEKVAVKNSDGDDVGDDIISEQGTVVADDEELTVTSLGDGEFVVDSISGKTDYSSVLVTGVTTLENGTEVQVYQVGRYSFER